jgi:hypothetical protein
MWAETVRRLAAGRIPIVKRRYYRDFIQFGECYIQDSDDQVAWRTVFIGDEGDLTWLRCSYESLPTVAPPAAAAPPAQQWDTDVEA